MKKLIIFNTLFFAFSYSLKAQPCDVETIVKTPKGGSVTAYIYQCRLIKDHSSSSDLKSFTCKKNDVNIFLLYFFVVFLMRIIICRPTW